ncbi:MAG: metal ABC transporter substrate-binding protein [Oscillospiraceae bacterium]|jgi:zinc transport system substrate-binding protein|nr:metal ABC transporter substrate-binding protein [Oscillospiraceae bacterium]
MKRILSIAIAALLAAAALTGCAETTAPTTAADGGKISVVATIFPPYDFTRAIAGDKADISMLLLPGAETHSFEPTPRDVLKIQNCDVFIYAGGESDDWVKGILDGVDTSKMKIITLMDCVEAVEEEVVEGMQGEEEAEEPTEGGEEEPEYDEHVWTSPRNAKLIAQKISDTLCQADAANAETYRANTMAYLAQLDELDATFQAVADNAARKTIVFGDRFPFRYFADAYGLDYFAAFPGCATETEASPATVKFLIDKINAENIPVIFHIEMSNEKMANTISEATGAKVLLLHACHNISQADFSSGKTYIDLMSANVDALKEALN